MIRFPNYYFIEIHADMLLSVYKGTLKILKNEY